MYKYVVKERGSTLIQRIIVALYLSKSYGYKEGLTRSELAYIVGTTKNSLNYTMSAHRDKGYIKPLDDLSFIERVTRMEKLYTLTEKGVEMARKLLRVYAKGTLDFSEVQLRLLELIEEKENSERNEM